MWNTDVVCDVRDCIIFIPNAFDVFGQVGFMSRQRNSEGSGGVGLVTEQDRAERDPSTQRRKDKAKAKDDEKQEKRRLKEEERQRREREKEKERERKRNLKMTKEGKKEKAAPTLEDVVLAEGRAIPLFLETCVKFIEAEGLDSEGIYRVPGNRAHVDMLFQKLEEGLYYEVVYNEETFLLINVYFFFFLNIPRS